MEVGDPFLNIGITFATFRASGQTPEFIERLNSFSSAGDMKVATNLMNLVGKLS